MRWPSFVWHCLLYLHSARYNAFLRATGAFAVDDRGAILAARLFTKPSSFGSVLVFFKAPFSSVGCMQRRSKKTYDQIASETGLTNTYYVAQVQ